MPPKAAPAPRPQHARKPSTATAADPASAKDKSKTKDKPKKDSTMPPPPPPPSKPMAILEPELGALEESLKNATVTTAQIFRFYADTKRLNVQSHAPRPPRSMTLSLELDLARYDQICDALEANLSRAIAVLQRDLTREEARLREEEAAKARAKAAEATSDDVEMEAPGASGPSGEGAKSQQAAPSGAVASTGKVPLRRPSKISLSTLNRNPFPLKLDLSSASLRLGGDEGGLNMSALGNMSAALGGIGSLGSIGGIPGLASPVTLAPKSARPMAPGELPPDVLAALASASGVGNQNMQMPDSNQHIPIDLTLDDDLHATMISAGSSADKPIELDFDQMPDIFGEQSAGTQQSRPSADTGMDDLFSPTSNRPPDLANPDDSAHGMDMRFLDALSENPEQTDALFASFNGENGASNKGPSAAEPGADAIPNEGNGENNTFDYSQLGMGDIEGDMGDIFNASNQEEMDMHMMENLLNLGDTGGSGETSGSNSNAAPPADT